MKLSRLLFASLAMFLSSFGAWAAGPDFSSLTSAVDFSTVITAIMAIAAALAGVYVVMRGADMVLSKLRGR